MLGCGQSSYSQAPTNAAGWTVQTLASVVLPATAFPSPFRAVPDTQEDGGGLDVQRIESGTPAGMLLDALRKDGPAAGYRRNWTGPSPIVGYVELTAFHSNSGAADYASTFVTFLQAHGQTGVAVSDVASDATAFTASGPQGEAYSIVAWLDGVVVQVAAGGGGATLDLVKRLAKEQLGRL
jgi:hypothetical protein